MKELYIIRHGLAGKRQEDAGVDESRPLTGKGKGRMKKIAAGLQALDVSFDKLLTSPLARSKETAGILEKYCVDPENVESTDLLKPGSGFEGLISYLNGQDGAERVAVVGHEPFLSEFASYILTKSKVSFINLKKGGVLMIEVDGALKPGNCTLSWLLEPSQLVGLS